MCVCVCRVSIMSSNLNPRILGHYWWTGKKKYKNTKKKNSHSAGAMPDIPVVVPKKKGPAAKEWIFKVS